MAIKVALQDELNAYGRGLLGEESGELSAELGRGHRFGFDTPGFAGIGSDTAMQRVQKEAADMMAAIEWCMRAGVLNREQLVDDAGRKLAKLCDPDKRDNLGRPLAPVIHDPY